MSNYLNNLVACGAILSYHLRTFDADGNEVPAGSPKRVTDELSLTFLDGEVIVINTMCDACEENVALLIGRKTT